MYLVPFQALLENVLLLLPEGPVDDELLHLLVAEVDDQLLEPVLLEGLEPVDVEDAEDLVLPVGLHLCTLSNAECLEVEIRVGRLRHRARLPNNTHKCFCSGPTKLIDPKYGEVCKHTP